MLKLIKLIMVTGDNNNKYYNMTDLGNGEFEAEWGRVAVTSTKKKYPIKRWDSIYKDKIRKGYKDVTNYSLVSDTNVDFVDLQDPSIKKLVATLLKFTQTNVSKNYTVSADAVTPAQVEDAQEILNSIVHATEFLPLTEINNKLLEMYSIIPRRMGKVQNYLVPQSVLKNKDGITFTKYGLDVFNQIVSEQQDILDSMKSQVRLVSSKKNKDNIGKTLLESMGLTIENIKADEQKLILKELGDDKKRFISGYRVTNEKTNKIFQDYIKPEKNQFVKLLWHGSRNENWWSILDTGLLLRPTNVVVTGKMFGYGIYFADRAKKSLGYTSLDGSYWARGSSPVGFMALFNVFLGNMLETEDNTHFSNMDEKALRKRGGYHSVFAKAGKRLYNNEYIVYNQAQTTINYIVELK